MAVGRRSDRGKANQRDKAHVRYAARIKRGKCPWHQFIDLAPGKKACQLCLDTRNIVRVAKTARDKALCIGHYSNSINKCAECEISDIDMLTLDHVENDGKVHRNESDTKGGWKFYLWLIKNKYPPGLQVLCWNHNMKKEIILRRRIINA